MGLTMKIFFFILTLSLLIANSHVMAKAPFELQSLQTKQCALIANTDAGQKKIVEGDCKSLATYNYQTPMWFKTDKITEITAGCGTECAYSYFVNFQTGAVSPNYYLVTILDQKKQIIIYPKNDEQDNTLVISMIFTNETSGKILIQRDFSSSSATDVNKIQLNKDGTLLLSYTAGKDYHDQTETIKIDLEKLNSNQCWKVSTSNQYTHC